eukprot:587338-Pleurochrysis_carterae.AAC.1
MAAMAASARERDVQLGLMTQLALSIENETATARALPEQLATVARLQAQMDAQAAQAREREAHSIESLAAAVAAMSARDCKITRSVNQLHVLLREARLFLESQERLAHEREAADSARHEKSVAVSQLVLVQGELRREEGECAAWREKCSDLASALECEKRRNEEIQQLVPALSQVEEQLALLRACAVRGGVARVAHQNQHLH